MAICLIRSCFADECTTACLFPTFIRHVSHYYRSFESNTDIYFYLKFETHKKKEIPFVVVVFRLTAPNVCLAVCHPV